MSDTKNVEIIISAQAKVDQATKEVTSKLEGLKGSVEKMQPAFRSMAAVGTVAFAAISAVAVTSFKAFSNAQAEVAITNKSLENSLNSLHGTALKNLQKQLGTTTGLLTELQKKSEEAGKSALKLGFDDEEAGRSFAKLFGITKDVTQANKELTIAQDLARFKNISLEEATQKLVLVHAGATKELKALGLEVNKDNTALQNMDMIQKQVTGSALEFSKTAEGGMQIMKVNADNLKEAIGAGLQPAFKKLQETLVPVVQKFVDWSEKNPETLGQIILIGGAVTALVAGIGILGMAIPKIIAGFQLMGSTAVWLTTSAFGPWLIILAEVSAAIILINDSIKKFQSLTASNAETVKTLQKQQADVNAVIAKTTDPTKKARLESANAQGAASLAELERYQNSSFLGKVFFHPKDQSTPAPEILSASDVSPKPQLFNFTFNGDITDKNEFAKKIKDQFSQMLQVKHAMP